MKTDIQENKATELKRDITDSFLKTVSAYANYGTGRIIFGIADDKEICGLENPQDTRLRSEQRINDSLSRAKI